MPMMTNFPPGFANANPFTPFPTFGNHAVQAPNGWSGPAIAANGGEDGAHHVGPVRRGGGRFQSQRSGPYDRRQQNPRYGGGRLTPPRNGAPPRMGGGAGKWGDGAGAQTVGPREAVQGRSLKSYEDLDAVGASGGGELNY